MASNKHVYKIELEQELAPAQAAEQAMARLKEDGRKVKLVKEGNAPVISIDGASYVLSVASAAGSGIGAPCAVLREL